MDYKQTISTTDQSKSADFQQSEVTYQQRKQAAIQLMQQAEILRNEGQSAAEFCLAEQYEQSARLMI